MDAREEQPKEAIAIIGMACRFPGGAHNPEQFFANLEAGKSAWCEFPSDRLNIDGFYHPSSQRHDSFTFKGAHFLTGNIAAFDAEFFSMSATESNSTDVQQRILLEVAYEAVENAGIPKEELAGTNSSVYIGSFVKDYEQVSMRDSQFLAADCATGNGIAIMSNRISYFFDIHGPSMTIDTGCSASLICIHQAVQSLLSGESSMAMAGGAGMILTPATIMPMVSLGFLSKDGKCYTFDSRANGYGRGEGVGIVVLKRLSDAIRDNDTIRGVIRGTSTNQDGRTSGITLPSAEAQIVNIRKCYASAGVDINKTMFVECHGTGTQAGDPRELRAISESLCNGRPADKPMLVGSTKTNIGHLEGSAGVAGVIKAVMTIEKGRIPRHLNFESWNPDIDHRRLKVDIPYQNTAWPVEGPRRISVNSFGFGGSNAHVIIDDAAHYLDEAQVLANHNTLVTSADEDAMDFSPVVNMKQYLASTPYLYVISANDQAGVSRIVDAHLTHLGRGLKPSEMRDYAYTLFSRRSKLQYKVFGVARTYEELVSELNRIKGSQPTRSQKSKALNLGFVFCGQGAQWPQMGMDLCVFEPFRQSLEEASALLRTLDRNFDLLTILGEAASKYGAPKINNPIYAQPATTAVQIALVDLLTACGVKPSAVVGHSSGEIAAAYAAGMISKLGALTIAYLRGKAASHVKLQGSMLAVNLSQSEAQKYVDSAPEGSVCVACINSPESVTLSGNTEQIQQLHESLSKDGITSKLLFVATAYHSHHMKAVSDEYQALLDEYLPKATVESEGPAMFSSVLGQRVSHADLGPSYWVNNMVSPVGFEQAVTSMIKAEKSVRPDIFLEVSPHSVFGKALSDIVGCTATIGTKGDIPYHPMMIRKKNGAATALNTLGELWARGLPLGLDWLHLGPSDSKPKCLVDLPTYPWDHTKTYWHESHLSKVHRFRKFGSHDFLGAMTSDSITPQEPRWRGFIDITENPWIEHHKIQKKTMYPAAGMVVMAVEAAKQVVDGAIDSPSAILDFEISDFKIEEPMIIPDGETRLEYNFNATRVDESTADRLTTWRYSFTIYSIPDTTSAPPYQHIANARGFFAVRFKPRGLGATNGFSTDLGVGETSSTRNASNAPVEFANGMQPREFYERLNIIGLNYGRLFRNITEMSGAKDVSDSDSTKYCWTKVQIPNTKAIMPEEYETPSTIHPATLDTMFQSMFVLGNDPMVPYFIESIRISAEMPQGAGTEFVGYSEAKRKGPREAVSDIVMWHGEDGEYPVPVVNIRGLNVITMTDPGKAIPDFLPDCRNLCSQVVWEEDVHYAEPDGDTASRSFQSMLQLMGHRFPGMRVLQLGGDASVASLVLGVLASQTTPLLSSYLILSEKDDVFSKAQEQTGKDLRPLLSYEPLADKYNLADALKQQKFDVVLADSRVGVDRGVLIQVLKPTGVLAITHKSTATNGASAGDGVLSGHFKPTAGLQDAWLPRSWYSLPQAYPAKMSTETVIILTADEDDSKTYRVTPMLAALWSRLRTLGVGLTVKAMSLVEFREVLNKEASEGVDAFVVSLLELNNNKDIVFDIDADHYELVQKLFQKTNKGLLWVTAGAQMDTQLPTKSPFLGWARTVRSEEPDRQIVCLDLDVTNPHKRKRSGDEEFGDAAGKDNAAAICDVFFRSFSSTVPSAGRDVEFAYRDGRLYVPRLEPLKEVNKLVEDGFEQAQIVEEVPDENKSLKLVRGESGAVDDVYFKEDGAERELRPGELLVDVNECWLVPDGLHATSDSDHPGYWTDIRGTIVKAAEDDNTLRPGRDVVAIGLRNGLGSRVIVPSTDLVWYGEKNDVPLFTHSPTCLITASYCLRVVSKGSTVLIHGAAGAYGQAAMQISWQNGAEVFVVVANEDERKALVKGGYVDDDHIFYNNSELPQKAAQATVLANGMDFIFNPTASGRASDFKMICPYGQVIHLNLRGDVAPQSELVSNGAFTLKNFDLETFLQYCPERVTDHFQILADLEFLEPVMERSYSFGNVRTALKDLKTSPHSGMIMLRKEEGEKLPIGRIPREIFPAPALLPWAVYIVAGGMGGLGLDVVRWLADHGARKITIFSRRLTYDGATARYLKAIQDRGIRVCIKLCDINCWATCSQTIKLIEHTTAIGGIIQAAAVIKDGIYPNLTYDDWKSVTKVKTIGSYNLHKAAEQYCRNLDFFIFLSSAAGIIGNLGQANYNAGNSFQDALARHRSARGMHSVSIDLGPVLGAGMVAQDEALWDQLRAGGFIGVRLEDFHTVLERAVTKPATTKTDSATQPFICPPQVVMGVGTGGLVKQNKTTNPFWTRTSLFSLLNRVDIRPGSAPDDDGTGSGGPSAGLKPALKAASSRAEAANLLLPHFVRALGEVMGKNHTEIDPDSILDDHGPDSLRMKEVLDWISSATGVRVTGINQMPIRSICAQIAELGGFGGMG